VRSGEEGRLRQDPGALWRIAAGFGSGAGGREPQGRHPLQLRACHSVDMEASDVDRTRVHMQEAVIGLGSNLDDRLAHLQKGITALAHSLSPLHPCIRVVAVSRTFQTAPIGPDQPVYLNAVVLIETTLEPLELLHRCQEIERQQGRIRTQRWGPRTLDLDILDMAGSPSATEELAIPHPASHERGFVLVPWADVAPDWTHPLTGHSIRDMAERIDRTAEGIEVRDDLPLALPE
jgi:2-amino-4-hydroxy-6-hydroxymethyldihydropteridine diphosphokinase